MVAGLIPHRYARALYKFAGDSGRCTEVFDEMLRVAGAFERAPELEKTLSNPFISRTDKQKLLVSAAGANPGDEYVRFVRLVLDHKREAFARLMALAYLRIYRKANRISEVRITTATELEESRLDEIRNVVRKAFPDRNLQFSYRIDKDIIGGFVIDVDSVRMDASISNELEQLRQNLL